MSNDIRMEDGWEQHLTSPINTTVMKVTTAVRKDAQAICPVDTGALKASLTAINSAPMQGRVISDRDYAAAVELGFHGEEFVHDYVNHDFMGTGRVVNIRAHVRTGNTPEQPFIRPALYRTRDLESL